MNLLEESKAAKIFYPIGLPIPIVPGPGSYDFNFFYQAFRTINSFLRKKHIRPLTTDSIVIAYEVLQAECLDKAELRIIELASVRADKSYKNGLKRGEIKERITYDDINNCLEKYRKKKHQLIDDLFIINDLDDKSRQDLMKESNREGKRLKHVLLSFFRNFNQITRPLICARVSDNHFRILGRSLVNKKEQTGLELKEIKKYSPLGAMINGGVTIYQAIQKEKRDEELHQLELEIKKTKLLTANEELIGEKLKNKKLQIELEDKIFEKLHEIAKDTDVVAINNLKSSFYKNMLIKAYETEETNSVRVINQQGLLLDRKSISVIDTNV